MIRIHPAMLAVALAAVGCKGKQGDEGPPPSNTSTTVVAPKPSEPTTPPATTVPDVEPAQARALFGTLPARFEATSNPITEAKVSLGRMLYYDKRLSKNQDLACNSCHGLSTFGVDNHPTSSGHKGQLGARNSPTVYNAAGHVAQFWDGRAADVEAQAKGPVLNPVEMAMPDADHVVAVLRSIPGYAKAFADAFPGEPSPITYDNMARAIGAFERQLVTPAPFDRYVAGDPSALSPAQRHGLALFVATGCTACHNGPLVGGAAYQKLGAVSPYANTKDQGRFDVTKSEADRFVFKVPSLRNIEKTAPYFHDGQIADLPTAVATMARIQLGRTLPDADVAAIVTFLGSLTGELPAAYIAEPTLPPSGPKTPKPDPT